MRLNRVDLPTLGRPTSAMTGFMQYCSFDRDCGRQFHFGFEKSRLRSHATSGVSSRSHCRRWPARARQGAVLARQEVHVALIVADRDRAADGHRPVERCGQAACRSSRRWCRRRGRQAFTAPLSSVAKTKRSSPPTPPCDDRSRVQSELPRAASTAAEPALVGDARRLSSLDRHGQPPGRPGARARLAPRGARPSTSQRERAGGQASSPAACRRLADDRRPCHGIEHARLRAHRSSAARAALHGPLLLAVAHRTPDDAVVAPARTRALPATSGGVTTARSSSCFHSDLAACRAPPASPLSRDHHDDAAVGADAGGQVHAGLDAPQLACRPRLPTRRPGCRRPPATKVLPATQATNWQLRDLPTSSFSGAQAIEPSGHASAPAVALRLGASGSAA